jgi:hypothetical protein
MKQKTTLMWISLCMGLAAMLPAGALAQEPAPEAAPAEPTGQEAAPADGTMDPAADPNAMPAQESAPAEEVSAGAWPVTYAQRPLVLNEGLLRIDVGPADFALLEYNRGLSFTKQDGIDDTFVNLGIGAAYGVMQNLEVGAVVLPLAISPDFTFGDISAYGRYRLMEGDTEIGLQADVWIPTDTDFAIGAGVPVMFHLSPTARLDTGARVKFTFADPDMVVGLNIPLALNFNITDTIFLGARTGFEWQSFDVSESMAIPLGAQAGFNVMEGKLDLLAWFRLPTFLAPNAPAGADTVQAGTWQLGVGANFFLDTKRM